MNQSELTSSQEEIMKAIKVGLLLAVVAGWMAVSSSLMLGKPEYTKETKKACTYCHVKAGSKDLNDVGKCYAKNNHKLEGCESKEVKK